MEKELEDDDFNDPAEESKEFQDTIPPITDDFILNDYDSPQGQIDSSSNDQVLTPTYIVVILVLVVAVAVGAYNFRHLFQ